MTAKEFDNRDEFSRHETVNRQLLTINSLALQVGFDACGISKVDYLSERETQFRNWLSKGYNGEMTFLERNIDKRFDPRELVPNAKSVISVILSYYPGNPDITAKPPRISRYALCPDYHQLLKDKLHQLLELIRNEFGKVEGRAFVDSAPVLEKTWAAKAGLGWIGKNSLLINPKFGTFVFIGELIVDLDISPSQERVEDRCGACTRCIDACPTKAIVSPRVINTNKCIAYLTIEKESPLSIEEKNSLNGWAYGCDICQEACPWNGKIPLSISKEIQPDQKIISIGSENLSKISEDDFIKVFETSPILRAGFNKFKANIADC